MRPFDTGEGPKKISCPYCGARLDRSTGIALNNPEDNNPSPGDVSVCTECGEVAVFGDDMAMVKPDEETLAELMQDETVLKTQLMIKGMRAVMDHNRRRAYEDQLEKMAADVGEWREMHPNTGPILIQYNYQKEVGLIAALPDAIENKFVTINADARDMLEELGWLDKENKLAPTVNMVRAVLGKVFGEE